jgi:hypothetical protein
MIITHQPLCALSLSKGTPAGFDKLSPHRHPAGFDKLSPHSTQPSEPRRAASAVRGSGP